MKNKVKESSIVVETTQLPQKEDAQFKMPTWGLLVALVIALVILKAFIYIKDGDRHGK